MSDLGRPVRKNFEVLMNEFLHDFIRSTNENEAEAICTRLNEATSELSSDDVTEENVELFYRNLFPLCGETSDGLFSSDLVSSSKIVLALLNQLVNTHHVVFRDVLIHQPVSELRKLRLDKHLKHGDEDQQTAAFSIAKLLVSHLQLEDFDQVLYNKTGCWKVFTELYRETIEAKKIERLTKSPELETIDAHPESDHFSMECLPEESTSSCNSPAGSVSPTVSPLNVPSSPIASHVGNLSPVRNFHSRPMFSTRGTNVPSHSTLPSLQISPAPTNTASPSQMTAALRPLQLDAGRGDESSPSMKTASALSSPHSMKRIRPLSSENMKITTEEPNPDLSNAILNSGFSSHIQQTSFSSTPPVSPDDSASPVFSNMGAFAPHQQTSFERPPSHPSMHTPMTPVHPPTPHVQGDDSPSARRSAASSGKSSTSTAERKDGEEPVQISNPVATHLMQLQEQLRVAAEMRKIELQLQNLSDEEEDSPNGSPNYSPSYAHMLRTTLGEQMEQYDDLSSRYGADYHMLDSMDRDLRLTERELSDVNDARVNPPIENRGDVRTDLETRLAALRRQEQLLTEKLPSPPAELADLHAKLQRVVLSPKTPVGRLEEIRMALYHPQQQGLDSILS